MRYYDTIAKREFWEYLNTEFDIVVVDTKYIPPRRNRQGRIVRAGYTMYKYKVTCLTCGDWKITEWRRTKPDPLAVLGNRHRYSSDVPDPKHHEEDCHKRSWWYLSFSISFEVKVKVYLDIDLSAIYMAKYRGDIK